MKPEIIKAVANEFLYCDKIDKNKIKQLVENLAKRTKVKNFDKDVAQGYRQVIKELERLGKL